MTMLKGLGVEAFGDRDIEGAPAGR
jgi:hypothetical protein